MPSSPVRLLVLLCCLLLGLRMGAAHLHLCFDGQEPAATVHVLDAAGDEHPPAVAASHVDENVDLADEGLARAAALLPEPPGALLAAFVVLFIVLARPSLPRAGHLREAFAASCRAGLRPPLRGPPMTARA